ncbi:MAG TPA: 16S rRNA (cytosine(967)-C(5))-methyltransferase RsmB [Limnobacter sp.]|nr:16S rRNA (cytosine(967)-C(5))-methyltransferase RsmB [Limnobacter sp.]
MSGPRLVETDLSFALLKAASTLLRVLEDGRSLDRALALELEGVRSAQAKGAIQDLAYWGMRHVGQGIVLTRLLTNKNRLEPALLNPLMALGLALLWPSDHPKYPAHTVVDQLVNACAAHPQLARAKGLANGCLRNFLRNTAEFVQRASEDPLAKYNVPTWWQAALQKAHPGQWAQLLALAQNHPPMVLRVNPHWGTPAQYVACLQAHGQTAAVVGQQAVRLDKPVPVGFLPGFDEGHVSVQDSAAQQAAPLLAPAPGMRVLDACAAPGGKTGHVLELADVDLVALDASQPRLQRVQANVQRLARCLKHAPRVQYKAAPAERPDQWWDGLPFDAILADVPCTGSGVVRRHPDIPWLRRPGDSAQLSRLQHKILAALWSTLKPGGTLLLVTCSIFPDEGPLLAKAFEENHADALPLPAPGLLLPADSGAGLPASDGFFYARFQKAIEA